MNQRKKEVRKEIRSYQKSVMLSIVATFIVVVSLTTVLTSSAICEVLTIYTEEAPTSHYTDKDGKVKGYVYELILAMQKKMEDTTPIQMVPWARGYNLTVKKPNTALFSTTFTEDRRKLFKWVGPLFETTWIFYAKAGSTIKMNSLDDAKTLKAIGTYRDDVREQFLKSKGFTNLDSITDDSLNLKKLMGERISIWMATSDTAPSIAEKLGISMEQIQSIFTIPADGLFIAFNKDTPDDIVNKWAKAYDEIRSDGTMENIYKKWNVAVPTYKIPPAP